MKDPQFEVGQQVEATWHGLFTEPDYKPAKITGVKLVYIVRFDEEGVAGGSYQRYEDQIRPPKPSPEQAWEKALIIIGKRANELDDHCCLTERETEIFNRETRHQCYQMLGAAGVKITDEVKRDVRRLIGLADMM